MSNSTRKIKVTDKGTTVLLQAIRRCYTADGAADGTALQDGSFLVLALRPTAIDGRWIGDPDHSDYGKVVTLVRTDVKVVKPAKAIVVKAPKVVKIGLDLCHDKTDTNPFGKVTQAIAVERMTAWIQANAKRGADAGTDLVAIWLASGQKIAVAMRDLRAQAAVSFAAADVAREQAAEAARVAKAKAASDKATSQLAALQARVDAAAEAARAKATAAAKAVVTKAAEAKVKGARKAAKLAKLAKAA